MKAISLLTYEEGSCILEVLSKASKLERKETLKRGVCNVVEVTAGGTL